MDPAKRATLVMIEEQCRRLPLADRGNQLLAVVADYINDGDLPEARRVLGLVDDAYYDCRVPTEQTYLDAIVRCVEVFGADLRAFAKGRRGGAA